MGTFFIGLGIFFTVNFIIVMLIFAIEIKNAPLVDSKAPFLRGDVGYDEFINNPLNKNYI